MAGLRRSFKWPSENKKTLTIAVPRSESGFGFTVAWTKPPLVDYLHEGGNAEKAGLMPGDKIICINKIKVSKKGKEEIENIVKNVKDIMELEVIRPESELATRKRQTSLRRKESFTKKGSKMIIQDCNIMLWRRERAMLKLLMCEEDLLSAIALGKEKFIIVIRKHFTLTTPMELNILFGNIEEIGSVQERHVQALRQMTQGNDDCVGRLYQKQLDDRCTVLKTYIYGLHLAKIMLKYKLCSTPFRELIEKQEKEDGTIEISKFIEKPVKYIADVTTQLETLLSCTAVGHRDYVCLESVLAVFQNFNRDMTEVIGKLSCFVDFETIQSRFNEEDPYINLETLQEKAIFTKGPRNFSLVHPGRYWLFSGELSKIEGRHYIEYWALLLSDCLILTRRTEQRVLLVLDEPIMLRSIYQASFDIKKCDTEFRILFALEKPKKSASQRNQWVTWILRAPSAGVKLLWQTILTYQLSLYSTEALNTGSKARFVHARALPGLKELSNKKGTKYEESSFVTFSGGPQFRVKVPVTSSPNELTNKDICGNQTTPSKDILPLSKRIDLLNEIPERKSLERSFFSLNENIISPSETYDTDQHGFPRSKSFGNDIADAIPFIDSNEENGNQDYLSYDNAAFSMKINEKTDNDQGNVFETKLDNRGFTDSFSAPGTPERSDKYVQTDDSSESSEAKRTPKRRFPRLGTFERIKVEKKITPDTNAPTPSSPTHTRTGTSFRHRRHIKTTVSKEQLLKPAPLSPSKDEKLSDESSEPPVADKKKSKGLFSRLFKRSSKSLDNDKSEVNSGDVQMSNLDETSTTMERPPDYESAVSSSGTSWPEKTFSSDD